MLGRGQLHHLSITVVVLQDIPRIRTHIHLRETIMDRLQEMITRLEGVQIRSVGGVEVLMVSSRS